MLLRLRLVCLKLEVSRSNGRERAARTCRLYSCGMVGDEISVFITCPAYESLGTKYRSSLCSQGRAMRTSTTEMPQLALASFLWETRYTALRRIF